MVAFKGRVYGGCAPSFLGLWTSILNGFAEHRHGHPGHANQFAILIRDFYFPHMGAFSDVMRPRFAVDPSRANSANVVCINLLTDTMKETLVHHEGSSPGGQRFGKSNGDATVQHTGRLLGSMVDWHSTSKVVRTSFQNFNPKVPVPTLFALLVDQFKGKRRMPNRLGKISAHGCPQLSLNHLVGQQGVLNACLTSLPAPGFARCPKGCRPAFQGLPRAGSGPAARRRQSAAVRPSGGVWSRPGE